MCRAARSHHAGADTPATPARSAHFAAPEGVSRPEAGLSGNSYPGLAVRRECGGGRLSGTPTGIRGLRFRGWGFRVRGQGSGFRGWGVGGERWRFIGLGQGVGGSGIGVMGYGSKVVMG